MSMNKKTKKRFIAISITVVLIAAFAVGLWFFVQYQNDSKSVEVLPVTDISTQYWGDESSSSGRIVSDYVQEIYPSTDKIISDIFVTEGQEVSIGDPLLQYDKVKLQLDVESKEIAVKEADLKIDTAQKQLKKLQNTKAVATAKPTAKPTTRPTTKPTTKPTASPSASPVPPADVTLYSRLDLDSKPYAGSGSTEDPYIFLCTDDCVMTPEFLKWLLGAGAEPDPTPTPSPEPTQEPDDEDSSSEPGDEEESSLPESTTEPEPTAEPDPTPTPRPESDLASPFAAVFEVREADSNYGQLLSAFKLDGTQLSASFQHSDALANYNTLDSVQSMFGASPTPTTNPNNYNDMGYTSAELKKLIAEKKQEIKDLQHARKQAKLDLDRANLQLKNSTVLSNVDGKVKTLTDLDAAAAENKPFLVVSGDDKYYVAGVLSENLLGSVQVGDTVSVMDYMTGNSYPAQIVGIEDYPLDSSSGLYYYGSGNPNSSNYEFTAVLEGGEELQNGSDVNITMEVPSETDTDALYLWKAYIRDDDAGSYVMKAGINNRLIKQYLQTGKSIYGGDYIEIKSGITMDDYVAFPYGPDVKEGVRVHAQGSEEGPMSGESSMTVSAGGESSALSSGLFDDEDGEGNAGSPAGSAGSSTEGEAVPANDLPEGAVITGSDENGTYFETENGGGVLLD